MPEVRNNVLLPIPMPCTKSLRGAVAAIIRDIQCQHRETDQETAERLGVSVGTIRNARNEQADLGALTIAKIGAIYGAEAVNPYNALYGACAHLIGPAEQDPMPALARAMSALCDIRTPKDRLDTLPVIKDARVALDAWIAAAERGRIA